MNKSDIEPQNEFNEGDDVLISSNKTKQLIGKIQQIQNNLVYFVKYFAPEDTKHGRQNYHSQFELFKSSVHDLTTIDKIEKKVIITKNMEEFISKSIEEIQESKIFIIRQFYDSYKQQCVPEIIKEHICFYCSITVNPDEKIIKCMGCEHYYHCKCLTDLNVKQCPNYNCGQSFDQKKIEEINLKRKPNSDPEIEFIPLKKQSSKFTLKNTSKYSLTTSFQTGQIALNKQQSGKKNNQRPFLNINDDHYEKLKKSIEKYKLQYSAKFSKGVQKDREAAKENLFQNLMYGLAELTERSQDNQELSPEEQLLSKKNDIEQFDVAKQLAISIETCIFLLHNDNNKNEIKNNYRQKFRELLANLKDDKNSELRFQIIIGQISPDQLSKMSGRELANSEKKREWKKREELVLKSKTLSDQAEIITKSHKGQEFIQLEQPDQVYNKEVNDDQKESEEFSDLEENEIETKLPISRQISGKKINRENFELANQLKSLINNKQKEKLIERLEKHLPLEISKKLIIRFQGQQ